MKKNRKGIILAGGEGSRLRPITNAVSKQLLPIYDKPMIYYPLTTLMLAGIKEFLIITRPEDKYIFEKLLGDGNQLGIDIQYKVQIKPNGLAEAFLIGEEFICGSPVALILGDNLFHGDGLSKQLLESNLSTNGATVFVYPVKNPERYGVAEFNSHGKVLNIEEKPLKPKSNYVITGIYFYDENVVEKARLLNPSQRGELEITDLNNNYLKDNLLTVELMGKSMAWLDAGTIDSLHEASSYIKTLEQRQGQKIGLPEEVAWNKGWINSDQLIKIASPLIKSGYGKYLINLLEN